MFSGLQECVLIGLFIVFFVIPTALLFGFSKGKSKSANKNQHSREER